MAIIPTADDHAAHLASHMPRVECEDCRWLRRWPVKTFGYLVPQGGNYQPVGWDFDTSEPDTYPWLIGDMARFAAQEYELSQLPTIEDHERNTNR